MNTILLEVTGYFVRFFNRSNPGIPVDRNWSVRLFYKSTDNVSKVTILFRPDNEVNATVGTLIKRPDSTIEVSARLPISQYPSYIDLLRYEKPLVAWVRYNGDLTVNVSKPLLDFDFGISSIEPTGEGPVDAGM